jgi:secreted trypsin-like serine protease
MLKFLLVLVAFFFQISSSHLKTCGRTKYNAGLIVNGEDVKRGEFPFVVSLLKLKNQKYFCGANLITQKHALTGKTRLFHILK